MMQEEIKAIMAEVFEIEVTDIPDNGEMGKIVNWDSLNHLNLIVVLEEKYDVSFEPEEIEQMTNINKIVEMIQIKQ